MAFEIIFVNDGSRGRSWEFIEKLAAVHNWVLGINLMRNVGQHNALLCGIRAARYDTIATIDDDLQNPPEEIPLLLKRLNPGYDVVYGTPERQRHGLWRDLASSLTKRILQGVMGAATAKNSSAFRVFRTRLREAFANYQSSFVAIDVLLTWGTTRFSAVVVQHDPRTIGVSNYTFRKLMTHALNLMTGFTTWPLQLASILGFAFTGFGMLVFIFVIGRYLIEGGSVPGFSFLASIIALFSGVQLFALGIIGEYLARMHFRSMERPTYTVRETTDRPVQPSDTRKEG
jgi:glycosyltransferase involved in cell wall biosynthesis